MELKKQVCSLEHAKRLKELGVKQESLFWWHDGCSTWVLPHVKDRDCYCIGKTYAAFTVTELGELLPEEIEVEEVSRFLKTAPGIGRQWYVEYCNSSTCFPHFSADTEADARAKMLIYLLKNKLLNVG